MPRLIYTGADKLRVDAIVAELDPAGHDLTRPFREALSSEDWLFVVDYARTEIRAALEVGMLARTVAESARLRGSSNEQGIRTFLDSISWMRNFGVSDAADERFKEIADVDSPLFVAVDALLQLAQDRMFNTLDEEYVRLLEAQR